MIDFASPAMLGWLAAGALPWLINLWIRRRHVDTSWAAVDLLLAAVHESSRRLRLRQLLLIALRTAILLLVVVAAARPEWRHAGATPPDERTHIIIVLDQSFSMATRAAETSRWERATMRAREIVADAPAGDAFTVIAWSKNAENPLGRPTFDAATAMAAIESLPLLDTVSNLSAAVCAVDSAIAAAQRDVPDLLRTRIVVISDFAQNTWSAALDPRTPAAEGDAGGEPPLRAAWSRLAAVSDVVLENVDEGARQNLAIVDVALEPPRPVIDLPFSVVVQVESWGTGQATPLDVELLYDGAPLARQSAAPSPGDSAALRFEARIVDREPHVFEVRLPDSVDSLSVDNRRWVVTEATRGRTALCIADDPSASVDVARALNPRSSPGAVRSVQPIRDAIVVESIPSAGLAAADLSAVDAVFLCNVADLSEREQRLLARYVAGGGGLAVVLGDRIQPATYNDFLSAVGAKKRGDPQPLLSVQIDDRPIAGDWRLDPLDYRHPVAAPFAGSARAGLLGVRVSRYFPLHVLNLNGRFAPSLALALTSKDPALVVGDFGQGRIAVLATDPALSTSSEPWSSLAVSPSFVPLVRELFAYLTDDRHRQRFNHLVGDLLRPPVELAAPAGRKLTWKDPRGGASSEPPATNHRGVYTVAVQSDGQRDGEAVKAAFAVNVDPAESDLATIDLADLAASPVAVHDAAGVTTPRTAATSLAPYLIAAAIGLSLLELAIAWLAGRGWT